MSGYIQEMKPVRQQEAIEFLRRAIARCIIEGMSVKEVLKVCKDKLKETPK